MRYQKLILTGAFAGILAACGGGSSSGSSAQGSGVTLSGTAATGLAIANSTVSVECQGGSGNATTQSNGTYTVTVSGGSLPCALSVTANGQTLRSIVAGSGSSATANITPLTEMLVGALLQQNPDALINGAPPTTITNDQLKAAQDTVVSYLKNNDIDVTALGSLDFVRTPLTAATTTPGTGDTQDQLLDALKLSLPNLNDVVATLSSAPVGCAFAKSGKYTLINYTGAVSSATVDFTKNTIAIGSSAATNFAASSAYPCEFTAGTTTVDFASSGLAIYKDTATNVIGIALPYQPFDKAIFGDTYNLSGYFAANSGPAALASGDLSPNAQIATMTIGSDGTVVCGGANVCTPVTDEHFSNTINADGSVDYLYGTDTTSLDKVYSYVAPNGKKLFVIANASTSTFLIAAKQEAIDTSKIEPKSVWFQVKGYVGYSGGSGASAWTNATIASGTSVTSAITATQGTVTQHFDDGTADQVDTILWNTSTGSDIWNGMRHRNKDTTVTPNISARTGLSAIGMGFSTNGSVNGIGPTKPGTPAFTLGVKRPS